MPINVRIECDGDDCEEALPLQQLRRKFVSVNGRGYGFGSYSIETAANKIPDTWVWMGVLLYCPKCQKEIEGA